MMIFIFFFIYFLLSCLPHLLHSAIPNCPENFTCPNHSPFNYPLYNASNTGCGLIEVKCTPSGGEIQLGNQSHEIIYKLDSTNLFIKNSTFEKLVKEKSCEALMDNFTSPNPLLFSFSIIAPKITVFKCKKNLSDAQQTDAYFDHLIYPRNNRSCKDHNMYYKHLINNATVPSNLPHTCQVIQLPVKEPWGFQHHVPDEANIFSLLSSSKFLISFQLSAFCDECHKNNRHCHATNNGTVECLLGANNVLAEKKDRRLPLILDKSDVYSFGVVLIELISSMVALDLNRSRDEIILANLALNRIQKGSIDQLIDPVLGSDSDDEIKRMITRVAELAFQCLQFDSEMRPTMNEVLDVLIDIQTDGRPDAHKGIRDAETLKPPPPSETSDQVALLKDSLASSVSVITSEWQSDDSASTTLSSGHISR